MSKFKVQGVGLDTSTIDFDPGTSLAEDGYAYIYTSIPANNDYLIGNAVKSIKDSPPLIVYSNHFDGLGSLLSEHLETVGRTMADLLLIDGSAPGWENGSAEELLHGWRDRDRLVKNFGIQSPLSVEQLEILTGEKGLDLKYIALPVSPLEFNYDIIQWAYSKGIYVIGLNPMGGYLSGPRNIQAFSVPYLLGFCATYSDIVIVSGRSLTKSWEARVYLDGLIGEEADSKYNLKKSISQVVKPLKKAIHTSVELKDLQATLPYDDPSLLLDKGWTTLSLGSAKSKIPPMAVLPKSEEGESVEEEIRHYLSIAYYPKDGDQGTIFSVAKYKVLKYLGLHYQGSQGWAISQIGRIGNSVLLVTVTQSDSLKGFFIWQTVVPGDEHTYLLVVPGEDPADIRFSEIQNEENSDEGEANPNS